jgi:hypothetical protein
MRSEGGETRDLSSYVELRPDAEDRTEVEESLSALARA